MMNLEQLIATGQRSNRGRWWMNVVLRRVIPFNRPHRLEVLSITDEEVKVLLPYRRNNLNHLKGLHACGMATAAEYCSGLLLLHRLGAKNYRLIMKSLHMEYFYQGKTDAVATFKMTAAEMEQQIIAPLKTQDAVLIPLEIKLEDKDGNHLCTGTANWQLKPWDKVRTKVK
ncbi:MAG: DUF4442 domain-containing protein [Salibacteraceae bacterium]|mgnify:CR=1 FL=1